MRAKLSHACGRAARSVKCQTDITVPLLVLGQGDRSCLRLPVPWGSVVRRTGWQCRSVVVCGALVPCPLRGVDTGLGDTPELRARARNHCVLCGDAGRPAVSRAAGGVGRPRTWQPLVLLFSFTQELVRESVF